MEELVYKKRHGLVLLAGLLMLTVTQAQTVRFENKLRPCLKIGNPSLSRTDNLLIAKTDIILRRPIRQCACLSDLVHYTSSVNNHGARDILQQGRLSLPASATMHWVLASVPRWSKSKLIRVTVACASPV